MTTVAALLQRSVKQILLMAFAVAAVGSLLISEPFAFGQTPGDDSSPIFGVKIPSGYRQWELVAPSREAGSFDELRSILGNAISMKAHRNGALPFPDGSILVKLAWKEVPSAEFAGAFVPGHTTTVQVMVKDSKKYPSTGGWGFGRFVDGKPVDEAQHQTCFACHEANVKEHDFVFTRYAP
jgi:hypothetical protein